MTVPSFTPPAPVARKQLPAIRIDATLALPAASGKTLTLQRGAASTLPDLPPPPPPGVAKVPQELTQEVVARAAYQRRHNLNLGATVYDHKVSQVQWTDPETGAIYQALCGFDISLLAGIRSFIRDGETYTLNLPPTGLDSTVSSKATPRIPQVSPGQILITQGDPKNPDAYIAPGIIRDLIASEKERLLAYQSARKQQLTESIAWVRSHPPIPQDETFIFRPHRGSRYLAIPQQKQKGEPTR